MIAKARDWLRNKLVRSQTIADDGHRHALVARYFASARKFDGLSLRERTAIVLGLALLVLAVWDGFIMQDLYARERAARSQLELIAPTAASEESAGDLANLLAAETKLTAEYERRRGELERGVATLIDPARMPDVLTGLIASSSGLRLERIASLPVEELRATQPVTAAEPDVLATDGPESLDNQPLRIPAVAYVHGIEIVVAGDYAAIQSYLHLLEKQPWRFIWRKLELDAAEHPQIRAKIGVATLGLDRYWLSL